MEPGPVSVVEVTAETDVEAPPEIPLHLLPPAGRVALQLRTTVRRIAVGTAVGRDEELMAKVRSLPNFPGIATSPVAGTFVMSGPAWLGICAIGVLPQEGVLPIDWMIASLRQWFTGALKSYGVDEIAIGRVDGGWCPGFSDVAVKDQKLIGLGLRVTKDWIVVRGVMPVQPIDDADWELLAACHQLIDVDVVRSANTSLAEVSGQADLTVDGVIRNWQNLATN